MTAFFFPEGKHYPQFLDFSPQYADFCQIEADRAR